MKQVCHCFDRKIPQRFIESKEKGKRTGKENSISNDRPQACTQAPP